MRGFLVVVGTGLAVAACVSSTSVTCLDGDGHPRVCPTGTTCAIQPTIGETICAGSAELAPCDGQANGTPCMVAGTNVTQACHDGVCQRVACGDGFADPPEVCDDHNTTDGDGCSADCQSTEVCGNKRVDPIHAEQCDDGPDHLAHDGCSPVCTFLERPEWMQLDNGTSTAVPEPVAYHPGRRRVVSFGLYGIDTLSWDGIHWDQEHALVSPGPRTGYAIAYDDALEKVVLFSGFEAAADTWAWDGREWSAIPTVNHPAPRQTNIVYDTARARLVMFGGVNEYVFNQFTFYGDTWEFDGDWHQVTPAQAPSARYAFSLGYDPKRHVTVLFGGSDMGNLGDVLGDLWEYDGTTWTQHTVGGGPSARATAAMAFDPIRQKLMVIAGKTTLTNSVYDAWEWDGTAWTSIASVPITAPIVQVEATTDTTRGRVIVEASDGNVYEWDGTAWTMPARSAAQVPTARLSAAFANDLHRREIVMFGGSTNNETSSTGLTDTWLWDGAWHKTAATGPSARYASAMAYDSKRDETLLFGGCPTISTAYGDTWLWKDHAWSAAAAGPTARCHAGLAYDAARDRIVMFGGTNAGGDNGSTTFGDTWTWDGASWHLETPAMSPPARYGMVMAYDPIRRSVVMYGGSSFSSATSTFTHYADTWTWDGTTWTQVVGALQPVTRTRGRAAWDAGRARLVMFGGQHSGLGNESLDDAYEWTGSDWVPLAVGPGFPPDGRYGHVLASAPFGAGVVLFGGVTHPNSVFGTASAPLQDTWRLRWDSDAPYETCGSVDSDGDKLVGCADPDCWWLCTPLCPPGVSCASSPECGDGTCNPLVETCDSCAADCGACP